MKSDQIKHQVKSSVRRLLAIALPVLLMAPTAQAENMSVDPSRELYNVHFAPIENRPIVIRDEEGNLLGLSAEGVDLTYQVDGNAFRRSITPEGIAVKELLGETPRASSDGHSYVSMQLPLDVYLANGKYIEGGKTVLVAVDDFNVTRAVQPTGADDQRNSNIDLINRFTDILDQKGVTPITAPTFEGDQPAAVETAVEGEPVAAPLTTPARAPVSPKPTAPGNIRPPVSDKNGWGPELEEAETINPIITPDLGYGNPFPDRFLSSPTCSCTKGVCSFGDRFTGYKKSRRRPYIGMYRGKRIYGSAHHQGVDIKGGFDTPIISAAPGKIKFVGIQRGYGYTVVIDHGNGYQTQYAHLKELPKYRNGRPVRKNQFVGRGTQIGIMGSTGISTGPHLHFAVHKGRTRINPNGRMIATTGASISRSCQNLPDLSRLDNEMATALGNSDIKRVVAYSSSKRAGARARAAQ